MTPQPPADTDALIFTVHRCDECGRIEGERPQAGCCPGCGVASIPVPIQVVPADALARERERVERSRRTGKRIAGELNEWAEREKKRAERAEAQVEALRGTVEANQGDARRGSRCAPSYLTDTLNAFAAIEARSREALASLPPQEEQ